MGNFKNHYVISIKNGHAGAALKSQLRNFLPACTDSKFPRSGEERL